jgi:hypothetical protein
MNSEFRLLGQAFENGAAMPLGIALALAVFGIAATRAAISRTADARAVLGTQDLLHGTPKPQAAHAATRAQGWQA